MKKIPLFGKYGTGKFVLVDDEDYKKVNRFRWYLGKNGYAAHRFFISHKRGKIKYLHRFIFEISQGYKIDHINGDKLDNRKTNLRKANNFENARNSRVSKGNIAGYKGVSYRNSRKKRWSVRIYVNGKNLFKGYFLAKEEAALKYNEVAIKYYGEFAKLNLIDKKP